MLEDGMNPERVLGEVLDWFEDGQDIGLLLVTKEGRAAGSNRAMAWAAHSP